jgi:WD40 repeat protein
MLNVGCLLTLECFRFGPDDENLVYSASSDGTIKLWDLRTGNQSVKEFKGTCLCFVGSICPKEWHMTLVSR